MNLHLKRWRFFYDLIDEVSFSFLFKCVEVMVIAFHDVFDRSTFIDFFFDPTIPDEFIKASYLKELKVIGV